MAGSRGTAKLEWVVHNGVDTHVSTFAGLAPGARPPVSCPGCGETVVLHLGERKAWHAKHQPEAVCSLTQPETALHHNVKMAIAARLRGAKQVVIREFCIRGSGRVSSDACDGPRDRTWVEGWDEVQVERRVETRRPDLVLLRSGEVVGAIEVWVSHRVEAEKRGLYAGWGVQWVEVPASQELIQPETAWSPEQALPVAQLGPEDGYSCPACIARDLRKKAEQEAELERHQWEQAEARRIREELAAREASALASAQLFVATAPTVSQRLRENGSLIERILVFDRLLSDGSATRDALVIANVFRESRRLGAFLGVASDLHVLAKVRADAGARGYEDLRAEASRYLQDLRTQRLALDVPPDWFPLLHVLRDKEFLEGWIADGAMHRWPERPMAVPPWRADGPDTGADSLDLLRYFFVRYLSGLPVRHRWSEKNHRWFQPDILREEPWIIWPTHTRP